MTDDALIEAMANAFEATGYEVSTIESMRAALAVARPIIERETREQCAKIADKYVKNVEPVAGTAFLIARDIRNQ